MLRRVDLRCWSRSMSGSISQARAEGVRHRPPDDLFYNYYVPPVGCGSCGGGDVSLPAAYAPTGRHTYVTYQPLMPQEFPLQALPLSTDARTKTAPRTTTCVHWWW